MRKKLLSILLYICLIFAAVLLLCIVAYVAIRWPSIHGILIPLCFLAFCVFIVLAFNSEGVQKSNLFKKASFFLVIPICFWLSVFIFGLVMPKHFAEFRWLGDYIQEKVPPTLRLPLSDCHSIAVDDNSQVYCYSFFNKRIQLFNADGQFLTGWFVDIPGGSYRMLIDKNNNLRIASKTSKTNYFFESNGKLINKTRLDDYDAEFGSTWSNEAKDKFGNIYKTQSPFLFSKVMKITPDGKEYALVKEPYNLWLINMPLPGCIFLFASFLFYILRALCGKIISC